LPDIDDFQVNSQKVRGDYSNAIAMLLHLHTEGKRKILDNMADVNTLERPDLSDFWGSDVLRPCSSRACTNRRPAHGDVEEWNRPVIGNRWVQRNSNIAQSII
jgi:hypothetical protein